MASSKARDVLDAVHFASNADIPALTQVLKSETLEFEVVLRILLTYLPESTEPSLYVGLLQDLLDGTLAGRDEAAHISLLSKDLTDVETKKRLRKLHLLSLSTHLGSDAGRADTLTAFLLDRAHRIDREVGSLPFLQQLVEPFAERSETLRVWLVSILLPLLRLDYEQLTRQTFTYNLKAFESLTGRSGMQELLSHIQEEPGQELRCIVGPWMYGQVDRRRRWLLASYKDPGAADGLVEQDVADGSKWGDVNAWLVDLAEHDVLRALSILQQWDGPRDVDYGGWIIEETESSEEMSNATLDYAQGGLAAFYVSQDTSVRAWEVMHCLISRAASLSELYLQYDPETVDLNSIASTINAEFLSSISTVHLPPGNLLDASNPLTRPSDQCLKLAIFIFFSARILSTLGWHLTVKRVLALALFGLDVDQRDLLLNILHGQTKARNDDQKWHTIRRDLLWLQSWNQSRQPPQGVLCRIASVDVESEILKSIVTSGNHRLAIDIYCSSQSSPLPQERTESIILKVALSLYDNASNGNKTRGGLKKASDIIDTFGPRFPNSRKFNEAAALVLATHSLSFYSLTLQHGVPLLPVNIRAHSNPSALIDKVLSQNSKSYTKLDDLLEISRNLVRAGLLLPNDTHSLSEEQLLDVERRVIAKAIEASLSEEDFDTAYSYVVNRLSYNQSSSGEDVLWQAAYQAGRHWPKKDDGPSELRRLEQNMELLSQALQLAPPSALEEVLATWRECEANMNAALAKETAEEKKWSERGDRRLPGGFTADDIVPFVQQPRETTRKAMNEEAPMGLFDVARGAATALSKSAFPLRDQRQLGSGRRERTAAVPRSEDRDGEERVRKRDMVSNMVTGRLASGIGWVLGAPPVRNE